MWLLGAFNLVQKVSKLMLTNISCIALPSSEVAQNSQMKKDRTPVYKRQKKCSQVKIYKYSNLYFLTTACFKTSPESFNMKHKMCNSTH